MVASLSKSPTSSDVASFYDETLQKRLQDFVDGNERITRSLGLVHSVIDRSTCSVLEIGCGLGIAAFELTQTYEWLKTHAVDISPKTIAAAVGLFGGSSRLTFEVSEMLEVPRFAPYDVILLLDVYEHIPRETWPRFNELLARCLSATGAIVLTLPSPLHQEHLARVDPSGLQVVDETVDLEDLAALAKAVSGHIVYFSYVSIWRTNDYLHTVIRRGPSNQALTWQRPERFFERIKKGVAFWLGRLRQRNLSERRRRLVQERLGITVGKSR